MEKKNKTLTCWNIKFMEIKPHKKCDEKKVNFLLWQIDTLNSWTEVLENIYDKKVHHHMERRLKIHRGIAPQKHYEKSPH